MTNGFGAPPSAANDRIVDKAFADLSAWELYLVAQLRSQVFVVEQDCVFLDLDGRDTAPTVRHIWVERERRPVAVARLLDEGTHREIGRLATAIDARGQGLAARLIDYCLATSDGPWHLNAQAHLASWYARFGFDTIGEPFVEDGIDHIAMRRAEPTDDSR